MKIGYLRCHNIHSNIAFTIDHCDLIALKFKRVQRSFKKYQKTERRNMVTSSAEMRLGILTNQS